MEIKIGERLKKVRKEKDMSIARLSELSGVSKGMISQIENNVNVPSVVNLWKLAQALETSVNYFFEEDRPKMTVIRKNEHRILTMESNRATYRFLSPMSGTRSLDFVEVTLRPGEDEGIVLANTKRCLNRAWALLED